MKKYVFVILTSLLLSACAVTTQKKELPKPDFKNGKPVVFNYAAHLKATDYEGYQIISVLNPWKKGAVLEKYFLFEDSNLLKQFDLTGYQQVQIPIKSIVPMSTSFYGYLNKLGVLESIVGVENKNFVYNDSIRQKIESGVIIELGQTGNLSIERTIQLKPSLIVQSGAEVLSTAIEKVRSAGVPVAQNLDWQEQHPLGRAEWIKFFGFFYDKSQLADSLFKVEEVNYKVLVDKVKTKLAVQNQVKPTALLGYNYQGTWYMPGGKSYVAQFLRDAGALYPYDSDSTSGSIPLSYEVVFAKMTNSSVWLNPGVCKTKEELLLLDKRYERLGAYKTGEIYNFTKRVNTAGGNDYWESGPANPSAILSDLVQIFHPQLLPKQDMNYYSILK